MEKENIDISFEKQIPVTQTPSLESILDTFKYNSIANMETKEKIRIFQLEKKYFQQTIDKIRSIWDITLSTRNLGKLDSKKKKDFELYQLEWDVTVLHLDYLENQIKEASNGLLKAFQENENGELHHQYAMIKQNGFQLSYENEEVLVPDVIPGHLFYLLNIFCCLSSVVMNAVKIQYNVISLFENDPQEIRLIFNEELKPVLDMVSKLSAQTDKASIKSTNQDILADYIIKGFQTFCKKNTTRIPDWIEAPSVFTIVKLLNKWNKYNKSTRDVQSKMKDNEPYPRYRDILYGNEQFVIRWGEKVFAPLYIKMKINKKMKNEENRRKKGKKRPDALDRWKIRGDEAERIIDLNFLDENTQIYFDEEQ